MIWIVVACVLAGCVFLAIVCKQQRNSVRRLGKGDSHAGSARYKNLGSARREKKKKIGSR